MYHSFMLFVYNLFMAIFFVNQKEDPYPSCMAPSSRDPSIKVKNSGVNSLFTTIWQGHSFVNPLPLPLA